MNPGNSQNDAKARNWDRYHNDSDANLEPKNTKSITVLLTTLSNELCHAYVKNRESNRNNRNRKKYVNETNRKNWMSSPALGLVQQYPIVFHASP